MNEIVSTEGLHACLDTSRQTPIFLFKHSTRCPVSTAAHDRVSRYVAEAPENAPGVHMIRVVESRPVSDEAALLLSVRHESPQIILVKEGKAVWSASHYEITPEAMAEAAKQL